MKKKSLKTPQRRVNINSCPDEEFFRRDGGGGGSKVHVKLCLPGGGGEVARFIFCTCFIGIK